MQVSRKSQQGNLCFQTKSGKTYIVVKAEVRGKTLYLIQKSGQSFLKILQQPCPASLYRDCLLFCFTVMVFDLPLIKQLDQCHKVRGQVRDHRQKITFVTLRRRIFSVCPLVHYHSNQLKNPTPKLNEKYTSFLCSSMLTLNFKFRMYHLPGSQLATSYKN